MQLYYASDLFLKIFIKNRMYGNYNFSRKQGGGAPASGAPRVLVSYATALHYLHHLLYLGYKYNNIMFDLAVNSMLYNMYNRVTVSTVRYRMLSCINLNFLFTNITNFTKFTNITLVSPYIP